MAGAPQPSKAHVAILAHTPLNVRVVLQTSQRESTGLCQKPTFVRRKVSLLVPLLAGSREWCFPKNQATESLLALVLGIEWTFKLGHEAPTLAQRLSQCVEFDGRLGV